MEQVEGHSIWSNVQSWTPEPRCLCRLAQCCDHVREHGKHVDRVQKLKQASDEYAALSDYWFAPGRTPR